MNFQKIKNNNVIKKVFGIKEVGILMPLIAICVITAIINPNFLNATSLINLSRSMSFTLIGALGMTFILITGGIDLSVGSVYALGGMIAGYALVILGLPVAVAVLMGLLAGILAGTINGLIITKFGIPPLIVTLGMMYIARGFINVMSKGVPYSGFSDGFLNIGLGKLFGIPYSVYVAIVLTVCAFLILKYTVFGRSIMAIGGNEETTRLSGINIKKYKVINYAIMGGMAALAGIIMAARLTSAQANAAEGWEMTIIASVVIGGTSMFGGSGTIVGTVIGVAIMEVLTVAMTMLKIDPYYQNIVVGAIIILAVGIDTYRRNKVSGARG